MITDTELTALRKIALALHGAAQEQITTTKLKSIIRESAYSIQRLCDNAETLRQVKRD